MSEGYADGVSSHNNEKVTLLQPFFFNNSHGVLCNRMSFCVPLSCSEIILKTYENIQRLQISATSGPGQWYCKMPQNRLLDPLLKS